MNYVTKAVLKYKNILTIFSYYQYKNTFAYVAELKVT